MSGTLDALRALLGAARRILVFTGAGFSTGSGIPDFRGPQGIWTRYQPVYFDEFLAREDARVRHWRYKLETWAAFRDARPNAAHLAVAELERRGVLRMCVTQNIDGLHARAGTSAGKLVEIHGTNLEVECLSCGARSDSAPHFAAFERTGVPPHCACGGLLKPATISFGQPLREDDLARAHAAAGDCDLVLAAGSTLSVYPAARIPLLAAQQGAAYVIINQGPTEHDDHPAVTLRLEGDVCDILPAATG